MACHHGCWCFYLGTMYRVQNLSPHCQNKHDVTRSLRIAILANTIIGRNMIVEVVKAIYKASRKSTSVIKGLISNCHWQSAENQFAHSKQCPFPPWINSDWLGFYYFPLCMGWAGHFVILPATLTIKAK